MPSHASSTTRSLNITSKRRVRVTWKALHPLERQCVARTATLSIAVSDYTNRQERTGIQMRDRLVEYLSEHQQTSFTRETRIIGAHSYNRDTKKPELECQEYNILPSRIVQAMKYNVSVVRARIEKEILTGCPETRAHQGIEKSD